MIRTKNQLPDDPIYSFTNIQKQLPAPFIVYADFESILKPVDKDVDATQVVEVIIINSLFKVGLKKIVVHKNPFKNN